MNRATDAVAVIQAAAPLAQLIGYASILANLTSGTAREVTWLSHYAALIAKRRGSAPGLADRLAVDATGVRTLGSES